jgi:hypothetical protein
MAGSLNKVTLIGNLGKDPEIRRTQDGRPIAALKNVKKLNGTISLFLTKVSVMLLKNMSKKVLKSISKGSCKQENGKTKMAMIVILLKLFCKI